MRNAPAQVRFLAILFLLIVSAATLNAASTSPDAPKAVLFRADTPGEGLTQEQLTSSMNETVRAMGLSDRELPRVLVLSLSKDAAETMGTRISEAHRNTSNGSVYYEVWLVDKTPLVDLACALQTVLERHFEQTYTEAERRSIVKRVLRFVRATVSAKKYPR